MNRIRLYLTAVFVFIGCISLAQGTINMNLDDFYKQFKNYQYSKKQGEKSEIKGSPYESQEFVAGDITTLSHQRYAGLPLRFNIFSNQMEFKAPDGEIYSIGLPEVIDTIRIGEQVFIYYPYKCGSRIEKGYFKVLASGSPFLLQKMNVFLKPPEPAQPYKDPVPATFERKPDEFFLAFSPEAALKITGKKDLFELLKSHQEELEQFIKKNKTKFSKPEDLAKLMKYFFSIAKK